MKVIVIICNVVYTYYTVTRVYTDTSMASGNWSAIGRNAEDFDPLEPTMVLNFSNMNDSEIMATVIHQFGHALGLGHALMKPEHWNTLKPYVHLRTMMNSCGVSTKEDLEDQWTGKKLKITIVNYDQDSIMAQRYFKINDIRVGGDVCYYY